MPSLDPRGIADWFWDIIKAADKDKPKLRNALMNLTRGEIYRFALEFLDAASLLQGEPFTAYVSPDESEDGVEYITWWVVSQGKEFYYTVWEHPENMPKHVDMQDSSILYGVAEEVYEETYGEMPDIWKDLSDYESSAFSNVEDYLKSKG